MSVFHYGPDYPDETYVPHSYQENTIDLGEVVMNYAVAGDPASPALLLIPGQTESWWGYEKVMGLLAKRFQCRAVGPQGQGRATRTLGRYTLDNMGNDLVRFLALAVKRPVIVSGLSSGGLLTAWLSAYGIPGSIRGAIYEDTPLFAAELNPACGHSIRQSTGPAWALHAKFLGDRWSVGDWSDLKAAVRRELPPSLAVMGERLIPQVEEPPQELKEYDPEWARATSTGTLAASRPHMLANWFAPRVSRSTIAHFLQWGTVHSQDPRLFAQTLLDWMSELGWLAGASRQAVSTNEGGALLWMMNVPA